MAAMFVVFRHECDGLVDEEARRRMRLIVPHVRRAVLVSNVISYREAEALSFADVLDEISAGMFLVDGHGHIVHANVRGHALLAEGTLLHAVGQKLIAYDTSAEQALHDVCLAAGSGDAAVGTRAIALPLRARDGVHYVANVLPLTSGARSRTGINYQAVAAVFVQRAAMEASLPAEMIAKSYRLTATELRVLLAIVEVGGVPEVAKTLGIAETTIKTHLGHIFQKTETSRQVDLVKLVASFGSPFRS
jgi:DNA-binding CsgD family transcriptional regulator